MKIKNIVAKLRNRPRRIWRISKIDALRIEVARLEGEIARLRSIAAGPKRRTPKWLEVE